MAIALYQAITIVALMHLARRLEPTGHGFASPAKGTIRPITTNTLVIAL